MAEIVLTQGKVALVDEADLPLVQGYRWHAQRARARWYAIASPSRHGKIRMHRLILPGVALIDHRNRDGLDNRRHNLRAATESENRINQPKCRGAGRFKGVDWDKARQCWRARVRINGRLVSLGRYAEEVEAAAAYNAAALAEWGEFAWLNDLALLTPGEERRA